jgi:exodeoxyribonuclease V gamma subunit
MSARDCLYISYSGQSDRDNTTTPPSVVVSELLDYVRRGFTVEGQSTAPDMITRHRLHSFSEDYFNGGDDSRLFSYATENRDALESGHRSPPARQYFIQAPLADDPLLWQELSLQQLIRFLHNPARAFLNRRMNISPYDPAEELEEQEPFALDGLKGYSLKQELTERLLSERACDDLYLSARAKGLLPPLHAGKAAFEAVLSKCSAFAHIISSHRGVPLEPLQVAHPIGGTFLNGVLGDIRADRHVRWRCAGMKGKDLLTLWCEHLVLNALKPDGYPRESMLICMDRTITLPSLDHADDLLEDLVELYRDGMCRPLHFFPQSSWLFVTGGMGKAADRWSGADHSPSPAESSDPSMALCFAGQHILDNEFITLAERIYGPPKLVAVEKKTA